MAIIRSFDIRHLKPYHREGDTMPKPGPEQSDQLSTLDPDLRPDEQSYVSHYLNYADVLLNQSEEGDAEIASESTPGNVVELPSAESAAKEKDEDTGEGSGNVA